MSFPSKLLTRWSCQKLPRDAFLGLKTFQLLASENFQAIVGIESSRRGYGFHGGGGF